MFSEFRVQRRLIRERKRLMRMHAVDEGYNYVMGQIDGIEFARKCVDEASREARRKFISEKEQSRRFEKVFLYRQIQQAYNRLKGGERASAIRALEEVVKSEDFYD